VEEPITSEPLGSDVRRRDFLRWLAASPLLPCLGGCGVFDTPDAIAQQAPPRTLTDLVVQARDALDVFDMERVAEAIVPPAHFGYIKTDDAIGQLRLGESF
jgi:hypothetical protein